MSPTDWAWLSLALNQGVFFAELRAFLPALNCSFGPELADVLRFQQDVVLSPDYDEQGKRCAYGYDLPAYFGGSGPDELQRRPVVVHFQDRHLGPARQLLRKGDPARFVNAALPGDWSAAHGHYQHQLSAASISYPEALLAAGTDRSEAQ